MTKWINTKFTFALSMALILALLVTSLALADYVVNNVDTTIDPAFETRTITAGSSTIVGFFIQPSNTVPPGDANGCNSPESSPATITLNVPLGVTASPSSFQVIGCGIPVNVTFSSNTPKTSGYTISVSGVTGGKAGSLWDTAPASFTLIVNSPPDTTPPQISYVLTPSYPDGNNGWYKSDVTLTWTVIENESPGSLVKTGCVDQNITADQEATTYSCSATSAGGSAGPVEVTIKRDATAPIISLDSRTPANGNGWNNTDVNVDWSCSDALSGPVDTNVSQTVSGEGADLSAEGTCEDLAGNTASDLETGINIDRQPPAITDLGPTAAPNGTSDWYVSAVDNAFQALDNLSGISGHTNPYNFTVSTGTAEGSTVTVSSGTVSDLAGNEATAIDSTAFKIDLTDPTNVAFVSGPESGAQYYFGDVPSAPTCTADDAVSGLASCVVTGYSVVVGSHTLTATATDNAGRTATATRSYKVLAWTIFGFYQPVDMGNLNNAKGGSTVPLKFEVFAGPKELTSTSVVQAFTQKINCAAGTGDDIEQYATGGTSLRYDLTSGQFIFNWQTPKAAGSCYRVTMVTQDGTSISADFRLK